MHRRMIKYRDMYHLWKKCIVTLQVNVHVDELSSARIWQHKLCAILSANININYRLPIKVHYVFVLF
jgi:hypothetical protein